MFDIHHETLQLELKKLNNLIPITIKDAFNCKRTVWMNKNQANVFWATDLSGNVYKLFPSQSIQILKIGGRVVQSIKSYKEEREIYFEIMKNKKQAIYKQAYQHNKISKNSN